MLRPRTEQAERPDELRRFTVAERWVHRTTSTLMIVAILSAAFLYLPQLAEIVGRRRLLVTVHEWSGVLLPLPLAVGLGFRSVRADLRRLNRFRPEDRGWAWRAVRHGTRRAGPAGKFNAGQKLYAAFIAGATLVMVGTGLVLWFPHLAALDVRTGATFVHDWLALVIGVLVLGHIRMAFKDPEARHGMRTGWVGRAWARREHPLWAREETTPEEPAAPDDPGPDKTGPAGADPADTTPPGDRN
ncbi:cytochrome b/b6 domain-containing protein [Streptacidiphilus anmyonensis]|uniref:cytochrome b/b6 domain-containing protein n=1 Tax=Streptacidiphilus anmyonensis TaxID=405782 RepID=UPI0007C6D99F|nr:cytochrome b/b6 domain-containing protein [Streptacidiphilus anmyonensis]